MSLISDFFSLFCQHHQELSNDDLGYSLGYKLIEEKCTKCGKIEIYSMPPDKWNKEKWLKGMHK